MLKPILAEGRGRGAYVYAYGDAPAFFFGAKMALRGMKRTPEKG